MSNVLTNAPTPTPPDPQLAVAFDLGWHMASLYRTASLERQRGAVAPGVLPDVNSLSPRERTDLVYRQVVAALHLLRPKLTAAGLDPIELPELESPDSATDAHLQVFRSGIEKAHVQTMKSLGAVDFRLGQAYGLGQGLADTSLRPDDADSFDDAFGPRLASIKNWLADLSSALSAHAGRSVLQTLRAWELWAAEPTIDDHALDWGVEGAGVRAALRRQGELWRALLSGEKQGPDMLKPADYLKAGRAMLWRLRWAVIAVALLLLLLGAGVVLLVIAGTAGKVLGAVATVAGTVGLTGAGVRARLSSAAMQLEARIWGAELDAAIAEAVLTGPDGWGVDLGKVDVPASGAEPRVAANLETLRRFRSAVSEGSERRIKEMLSANVRFTADGRASQGVDEVLILVLGAQRTRIASEPQRLVAGRPGFLLAYIDGSADVWRVREGKIRSWQRFADVGEASRAAGVVTG